MDALFQNVQLSPDDNESSQDFGSAAPTPLSAAPAPSTVPVGDPAGDEGDSIDTESGIVDEEADKKCVAAAN